MAARDLATILEQLPDEATVPVGWIRERLSSTQSTRIGLADLTVEDVADELGRSPSTVRGWLQTGDLRGYKLGREWRVPRTALREFLDTLEREYNGAGEK